MNAPKSKTYQIRTNMQSKIEKASAIKAAPSNQPAMKYQEESFKAGTASEKPATPKPAMNQILLGYAEAVKMRKNGKVAPKKKAAEEEAAKLPLSSTQKHLGAEGTEKEKASDSQDNLSNQTVKERDKEKIDKKGKGKAILQIEEHQGQITKCGKKRVLETVKTSDDMHEGKLPSKKAKRDLSSLGDVSSARPGVRKVTSGTSQPSGGVGDGKQNSRGGNSGADGGESSRLGRHASESFRGSGSGGGGKKRKATGDGDSEEDEDDKPRRNKPNSKPSGRKTKKARKRSDKDLNASSDEDDTDGKLKDPRSSASGRLPTARPREARKVMKTRDSDRQPSSSGSGGDSGSSWASQSGRYWTNEKFPKDDDAENGEEDTHTHTTGPLSGSSVLAGAELEFQLDELEKARELRQRIRESNHPELAYDIGLTPALISDLSHNRGQHSKLSLKDTPEWVARHLFGDRYNHETDQNLTEDFFERLLQGARAEDHLDERLVWEILKNMLQTALKLQPNTRNSQYKNNNKTRQVVNLIWQLMTFGRFYDTVKEEHYDPDDAKNEQLYPIYSEHLVTTISAEVRDDLSDPKTGKLKQPKSPRTLIEEAINQIKLLDTEAEGKQKPQGASKAGGIEFVVEVKDDGSPPPGLGMQSVAVSDASYERMDEEARDRELRTAEELRDRIANTTHLELEPLDGLPPGQIAGLRKNQGKDLPKLSLRDTKEWVARHLIGVYDDQYNWDNFKRLLRGAEPLEEKTIWVIFRNMARTAHELQDNVRNNDYKDNNKGKQVASLAWQLMTYGRFYDQEKDILHDPHDELNELTDAYYGYSRNIVDYLTKLMTMEIKKNKSDKSCVPQQMIKRATEEIEKLDLEAKVKSDTHESAEERFDEVEQDYSDYGGSTDARDSPTPSELSGKTGYSPVAGEIYQEDATEEGYIEVEFPNWFPEGLPANYDEVYDHLENVFVEQCNTNYLKKPELRIPHVVVIYDMSKSIETVLTTIALAELHRLQFIKIQAVVATLMPARSRAELALGVLELLDLPDVPVGIGTTATTNYHDPQDFEFDGTDLIKTSNTMKLKSGSELLETVFRENIQMGRKARLVLLSSFTDIAYLSVEFPDLITEENIDFVSLQGKYKITAGGQRIPDLLGTTNNRYDEQATKLWHQFMDDEKIPSTVWTDVAATGVSLEETFWDIISLELSHPIATYLSTRRASHEEPMTNFANVLAAIGCVGDNVINELSLVEFSEDIPGIGRIVGKDAVPATKDKAAQPEDKNVDTDNMIIVIQSLVLGNLLATKEKATVVLDQRIKQRLSDRSERKANKKGRHRREHPPKGGDTLDDSDPDSEVPKVGTGLFASDGYQIDARTQAEGIEPEDIDQYNSNPPQGGAGRSQPPESEESSANRKRKRNSQSSTGERPPNKKPHTNRSAFQDDEEEAIFLSLIPDRDPNEKVDVDWTEERVSLREAYVYFVNLMGTNRALTRDELIAALGSLGK